MLLPKSKDLGDRCPLRRKVHESKRQLHFIGRVHDALYDARHVPNVNTMNFEDNGEFEHLSPFRWVFFLGWKCLKY